MSYYCALATFELCRWWVRKADGLRQTKGVSRTEQHPGRIKALAWHLDQSLIFYLLQLISPTSSGPSAAQVAALWSQSELVRRSRLERPGNIACPPDRSRTRPVANQRCYSIKCFKGNRKTKATNRIENTQRRAIHPFKQKIFKTKMAAKDLQRFPDQA